MENPNSRLTSEDMYIPPFWSLSLDQNYGQQNAISFETSFTNLQNYHLEPTDPKEDGIRQPLELEFSSPKLDTDSFSRQGLHAVSEKLRDILQLSKFEALFIDLKVSGVNPLMEQKNLQALIFTGKEDVIDLDKSDYRVTKSEFSDFDFRSMTTARFKPNVQTNRKVFRDAFFNQIFCTNEIALRLLSSDCVGFGLYHPGFVFGSHPIRLTREGLGRGTGKFKRNIGDYMTEILVPFDKLDFNSVEF
ncbi:hypothetical protein N9W89_14480 [Hellea sp.]|nr:hypothetical protein [Hellea sp.]